MHKPEKCTLKPYAPVRGAPLRGDILRQLADPKIKQVEPDMRIPKRALEHLFCFEPLVALSSEEETALKAAAGKWMACDYTTYVEKTNDLLSGRAMVGSYLDRMDEMKFATRKEIAQMLLGKDFAGDVMTWHAAGGGSNSIPRTSYFSELCSCDLESYMAVDGSAIPVLRHARALHEKNNRPIRILDVGANGAQMLYDLKGLMGDKIETHALAPFDEPHHKVDNYHMLIAERMPASFRESFDIVVMRGALNFAMLAHRALENIAEALAPGGIAIVMMYSCEVLDDFPGWEEAVSEYAMRMKLDVEKYLGHNRCGTRDLTGLVKAYRQQFEFLSSHRANLLLALDAAAWGLLERSDVTVSIEWGKYIPYSPNKLTIEKKG